MYAGRCTPQVNIPKLNHTVGRNTAILSLFPYLPSILISKKCLQPDALALLGVALTI